MFALVEDFSGPEVEGSPLRCSTGIGRTSKRWSLRVNVGWGVVEGP